MKPYIILAMVAISGCTAQGELLTGKYCEHISYVRNGNEIKIDATCQAPYAIPQLPVSPATLIQGGIP